jgi:hypothetical protein
VERSNDEGGRTMSKFQPEALGGAVTEAASKIKAILSENSGAMAGGTQAPEVEELVGSAVDEAVLATGGDAAALFAVSEALSALVPVGARRLRSLCTASRHSRIIEDAAVGLFELVAGDFEADAIAIGRRAWQAIELCGGPSSEADVVDRIAATLSVPAQRLRQCMDVFTVYDLCGKDLDRRLPGCPFTKLLPLSRIAKKDGLMPWHKKRLILDVAHAISRGRHDSKRIESLINRAIAKDALKVATLPIVPAWHVPPALATKTDAKKAA